MPEVWLVLDKQDVPFDDYVDIRSSMYQEEAMNRFAKTLSLRPLEEFVGHEEDDWEAMREEAIDAGQPDAMPPWTPAMRPYFPASEGIEWCRKMRAHLESLDNPFPDDPGAKEHIIEDMNLLEDTLVKADRIGAKWGLMYGY